MRVTDDLLQRLLKAAANAPRPDPGAPPFALESRILAVCRSTRAAGEWDGLLRFLRMGLGFASILTAVIIALSLHEIAHQPGDELTVPNVTLNFAFLR